MDTKKIRDRERDAAYAMTQDIKDYAKSLKASSDAYLIKDLKERGNKELSERLSFYLRETENIDHLTYHIQEDMEDDGEEQARSRANYIARQASFIGVELSRVRREAIDFLAIPEELYCDTSDDGKESFTITNMSKEIKRFFAKHPKKLYNLSPRSFEVLVADILRDIGFETELTQASRDGGYDIYAHARNQANAYLMFVECKRFAANKPVGIEIVQRMFGVAQLHRAKKSMIVTTSFFTKDAKAEQALAKSKMELKDYNDLRAWLQRYKD